MAIRNYIILSRLIFLSLLAGILTIGWLGLQNIQYHLKRSEYANKQLVTLACLSSALNNVNMHIGRMFIINNAQSEDLQHTRNEVAKLMNNMKNITLEEFNWVKNTPEQAEEEKSQKRIEHLLLLSNQTARLFDEIITKFKSQPAQSRNLYTQNIISQLEPRIKLTIKNAVSDEEAKILGIRLRIQDTILIYGGSIAALIALIAVLLLITGPLAFYSIVPQLRELAAIAAAIPKVPGTAKPKIQSHASEIHQLNKACNKLIANIGKTQARMVDANSDLEEQITDRTKELLAANAKLKRLDNMRIQFLADIGHELKTPITALKGEAEIILRKSGHSEQDYRSTLTRIKVLTDQMNFLVDDLLFLSRSETDTVHFEFKRTDLEGILASVINGYEILGRDNNIRIEIQWGREALEIPLDISRIKQAFGIVLDNAIKYAHPNTDILITITSDKDEAILTFTNMGSSISEDDLPFIFERFYRGKETANQDGIGLGLAIAKWIIEKHQGSITISSTKKGITDTTITLPRKTRETH